ncbi:hypothetical protein DFH29DRAFT_879755 [Suillus ampliporus]|nr:hypothetical protein DFH29DRAFT_879755 [Suillus ampliporus]
MDIQTQFYFINPFNKGMEGKPKVPSSLQARVFSTVWLAKDAVANCCMALKIVIANLPGHSRESVVLKLPQATLVECLSSANVGASISSAGNSSAWQLLTTPMSLDLHFGNIGFKVPGLDKYTEDEMLEHMGNLMMLPMIPQDHSECSDSLLIYIVLVSSIMNFMPELIVEKLNEELVVEIMDFGNVTGWEAPQASRHATFHQAP